MSTVESKIVTMKFDNKQFLSGIASTIAALGTLKRALTFSDSRKSLGDLQKDAGKFNLKGMTEAAGGVSKSFAAMATVGITALATLTTKAVTAGASMVKSLSLDPILQGFQEYELNIRSIQTILANTKQDGTNLQQVNAALDELNTYADKTIYNFAEMTRNIGTFTAAGVDLDKSVESIKGIANVAAISGSNSQQASTAMYQLSQAIATGSVKLMDWNSVVNAGMGGEVFQKALFTTGQALGTIANSPVGQSFEEWKESGNSFRDSLQEGWLTAEVLTQTLQAFTGEYTAAQLESMGYTREQAALLAELGQTGVEAATKVRTFTQLMDTAKEAVASGWSQTFRILLGDFNEATELFTGLSEAFGGMVESSAESRNALLSDWKELGGRTVLIEGIKNAFTAVSSVLGTVKEAFRDIFPPMTAQNLYDLTVRFRDFTESLIPSEATLDKIKRVATGFFSALKLGKTVISGVVGVFGDLFGALTKGSGGFLEFLAGIGDFFTELNQGVDKSKSVQKFFDKLGDNLKKPIENFGSLTDIIGKFIDKAQEMIVGLKDGLSDFLGSIFDGFNFDAITDGLNTGFLGVIALALRKLTGGFNVNVGGNFIEKISDSLDGLTGVLKAMQADLRANALIKIAGAIGILALSLALLASIDSDKLRSAIAGMAAAMTLLLAAFAVLNVISTGTGFLKVPFIAASMILLAAAVLVLAFALEKMSDLEWEEIAKGLVGVAGALAALSAATTIMSKNSKGMISTGIGLIALSLGLIVIAEVMEKMAELEWEEIAKGLVGVGGALLVIGGAVRLMPNMGRASASLLILGAALHVIESAISKFAENDLKETGEGLLQIAAALAVIAGAMHLMPKNMVSTSVGLLLVSGAIQIIADALENMGDMTWEEIGRGLTTLAGALTVLAIALGFMQGTLAGSFALIIAAGAIALLTPALMDMSTLEWEEIAKGLIALAGALTVIGIAAAIFGASAPLLILGGAALLVFGAGLALVGVAAIAFATAISIAVAAAGAGAEVMTAALLAIAAAIPEMMKQFAVGVVDFLTVLAEAKADLVDAFSELLEGMLEAGIRNIPKFGELFQALIDEGIKIVKANYQELIDLGLAIVLKLLIGIDQNMPKIVPRGVSILIKFMEGIRSQVPRLARTAADLIIAFINAISQQHGRITDAGFRAILTMINSMTRSVRTYLPQIRSAGIRLALAIIDGMTGGLVSGASRVARAAVNVASDALNSAMNFLGIRSPSKAFMEVGQFSAEGMALGLEKYGVTVNKAAEHVAEDALTTMRVSMRKMGDLAFNDIDARPVLTPVIDLSEAQKGAGALNKMFSGSTFAADTTFAKASNISRERQAFLQEQLSEREEAQRKVEYVQNNYSPKALSVIDIYRNTRSQLALAREAQE